MTPVTQAFIVEKTGLSKQAISKAVKAGHFTICKHGGKQKIDLDGHLTVEWLMLHPMKSKNGDVPQEKEINYDQYFIPAGNTSTDLTSKRSLENTKLNEQIEKLRIENQQKRGNLIAKNLIVKVFNRVYSILQNQFKPMGINAMPKISAVYNSSNIVKAKEILKLFDIEDDTRKRSEILNILNSGEQDRVNEGNQILEDSVGDILKNVQRAIKKFLESIEEEEN